MFYVEYRDLRAGERVLFESDSEGEARIALAPVKTDEHLVLVETNLPL